MRALRERHLWPPVVPSVVLVESLHGRADRDANRNRFLTICEIREDLPIGLARRAASLRAGARQGSAVDALVVAYAEPNGTVLTGDIADMRALAQQAHGVVVEPI